MSVARQLAPAEPEHPEDGVEHPSVPVLVPTALCRLRLEEREHVPLDGNRREAEGQLLDPDHGAPLAAGRPDRLGQPRRAITQLHHVIGAVSVPVEVPVLDRLLKHEGVEVFALVQAVQRHWIECLGEKATALPARAARVVSAGDE